MNAWTNARTSAREPSHKLILGAFDSGELICLWFTWVVMIYCTFWMPFIILVSRPVCLFVYLFACLFVCLFVCLYSCSTSKSTAMVMSGQ